MQAFLYITADGVPGGSATAWLDRTLAEENNVLLPGELPLATGADGQALGIEVYDPTFIDIQTWSTVASDVNATRMALYVLPSTRAVLTALRAYTPPREQAGGPVPPVITSNAVASATVTRTRNAAAACNRCVLQQLIGMPWPWPLGATTHPSVTRMCNWYVGVTNAQPHTPMQCLGEHRHPRPRHTRSRRPATLPYPSRARGKRRRACRADDPSCGSHHGSARSLGYVKPLVSELTFSDSQVE